MEAALAEAGNKLHCPMCRRVNPAGLHGKQCDCEFGKLARECAKRVKERKTK